MLKNEISWTIPTTTSTSTTTTTVEPDPICTTKTCVAAAGQVIEAMDETADPCQDFYQFACGGWMEKNPIPLTRSSWNRFSVLRDRVENIIKGDADWPTSCLPWIISAVNIHPQESSVPRVHPTTLEQSTAPGTCSRLVSIPAGLKKWDWSLWLDWGPLTVSGRSFQPTGPLNLLIGKIWALRWPVHSHGTTCWKWPMMPISTMILTTTSFTWVTFQWKQVKLSLNWWIRLDRHTIVDDSQ